MEDWGKRLNAFLEFIERDLLQNSSKVSKEIAKAMPKVNLENITSCRTVSLKANLIES